MGDKTTMFGKAYNTIGSSDSNFLIKTKGDLKILWGNKFIDLIKGGKIVEQSIFKVASSESDLVTNGIYLLEDTIWVKINDAKIAIPKNSTVYLSFSELQELENELKLIAQKNIGFLYNTLEDVRLANLTSGIVYVLESLKLYTIHNGSVSEYSTITNTQSLVEDNLNFLIGDFTYAIMSDLSIKILRDLVIYDNVFIQSLNASQNSGFRLYNNDESLLEVDNLTCRKMITGIGDTLVIGNLLSKLEVPITGILSETSVPDDFNDAKYNHIIPTVEWVNKLIDAKLNSI